MADERDDAPTSLARELARMMRLHEACHADPSLAKALQRLGEWQSRRLRNTYADLTADPRYTAAIAFFQNDLYGGADFSRRDADLARIPPKMVRLVPGKVLAAVAHGIQVSALSLELDRSVLARLPRPNAAVSARSEEDTAEIQA